MVRNPLIRKIPNTTRSHNQGHKSAGILDDFSIRKTTATKQGTIEHTPINPKDIVNKEYVDAQVVNTGIDLFAYNSASDTGSYKQFKLTPSSGVKVEGIVSVAGNATAQDVGARITEVDIDCEEIIKNLTTGVYNFHVHLKAATANRLKFYAKFYVRHADTSETLIGTTDPSVYIGTTEDHYDLHTTITDDYPLTTGDRIVVKAYASNSSSAATNIYIYVEGDTAARVSLRALSSPRTHSSLANLNWDNAGHTFDVDLDMNNHQINNLQDESSADTAYVATFLYGTDATPPAASGFPIGSIYVQHTA